MTPIEWLDHTADMGFRASGTSLEEAFCEAARALFSRMFALDRIEPVSETRINIAANSLPDLLVEWLSELLGQKELTGDVFSQFQVTISGNESSGFRAQGCALGETLDRTRHQPGTEIKGISYLGLAVIEQDGVWTAQVVVDV